MNTNEAVPLDYYARYTLTKGTPMQVAATNAVEEIERLRAERVDVEQVRAVIRNMKMIADREEKSGNAWFASYLRTTANELTAAIGGKK